MIYKLLSIFACLVTIACGNINIYVPGSLDAPVPNFEATGKSFFLSTDCTQNSLGISVTLAPQQLQVEASAVYVSSRMLTLDYAKLTINEQIRDFTTGGQPVAKVKTTARSDDLLGFNLAVKDMLVLVRKVQAGNVCYQARRELGDVVSYLENFH